MIRTVETKEVEMPADMTEKLVGAAMVWMFTACMVAAAAPQALFSGPTQARRPMVRIVDPGRPTR